MPVKSYEVRISRICHAGEFLYLAAVIDCFSRRLVGWSIAEHMRTELVENALGAAALTRRSLAGAVFHADHGSQYISKNFASTMPWPSRSMRHSNAKRCKAQPAGNHLGRQGSRCSGGSPATTPDDGTRTATISAPPTTKPTTHPIACSKPLDHKPRVQSPESKPAYAAPADTYSFPQ